MVFGGRHGLEGEQQYGAMKVRVKPLVIQSVIQARGHGWEKVF